jgi:predicted PurR-regulated permease PerM
MDSSVGSDPTARVVTIGFAAALLVLAALTIAPLWLPLAFALWTASLLDPLAGWIALRLGNRRSIGAALGTVLVALLIVPIVLALTSVGSSVVAFVRQVMASPAMRSALEAVVSPDASSVASSAGVTDFLRANVGRVPELARQHGATAWRAASGFAGAGAVAGLTVFVYFVALYAFLEDGREMWRWAKERSSLDDETCERMARAFVETGRGIIVGAGLTALTQALLATVIYAVMGVPRFAVLGALTFVCAFVPAVGTAVVWGPVAVGLVLKGQVVKGVVLAVLGAVGISSIDNVVRPLMQRWGGNLRLPAFVLLLAAFGGLAAFGAKGLVLGPLAVRLAAEVLDIARERRAAA